MISAHITGFGADMFTTVQLTQEQLAAAAKDFLADCTQAHSVVGSLGPAKSYQLLEYIKTTYPDQTACAAALDRAITFSIPTPVQLHEEHYDRDHEYPGAGDGSILILAQKTEQISALVQDLMGRLPPLTEAVNSLLGTNYTKIDLSNADAIIAGLTQLKAKKTSASKTNTTVAIIAAAALGGGLILLAMRRAK